MCVQIYHNSDKVTAAPLQDQLMLLGSLTEAASHLAWRDDQPAATGSAAVAAAAGVAARAGAAPGRRDPQDNANDPSLGSSAWAQPVSAPSSQGRASQRTNTGSARLRGALHRALPILLTHIANEIPNINSGQLVSFLTALDLAQRLGVHFEPTAPAFTDSGLGNIDTQQQEASYVVDSWLYECEIVSLRLVGKASGIDLARLCDLWRVLGREDVADRLVIASVRRHVTN